MGATKRRKRDEVDRHLAQAKKAFAKHVLAQQTEDRWILRRKQNGQFHQEYWCEIISLGGGQLFVGGDIEPVTFGYYSDTKSHEDKLRWMGDCRDFRYYVVQKATIGSGRANTEYFDADIARRQLEEILKNKDHEWSEDQREVIEEALARLDDRGPQYTTNWLYENLHGDYDFGAFGELGRTIAPRVIYAYAALQACCRELDKAKKKAERKALKSERPCGPP